MAGKFVNAFKGKRILLIGASAGIGYGIAEACLDYGAHVVIASRSQSKVDAAIKSLQSSFPDAHDRIRGHTVSIGAPDVHDQLQKLFDFATDGGKNLLDHVVESAGDIAIAPKLGLDTITPALIAEAASVRLVGAVMIAKFIPKYVNNSYRSSYTLTTGALTYKPPPGFSVMLAANGGKDALNKALAKDFAPIRVNTVSPGAIDTELFRTAAMHSGKAEEHPLVQNSFLKRIGTVEDTAEIYVALMKSGFITGTVVDVEGGYLLS